MTFGLSLLFVSEFASAWTFSPDPICRVTEKQQLIEIDLTYDHATEIYAIAFTKTEAPWAQSQEFSIRFEGPRPKLIRTNRHQFSADGFTLTASDTGFGNVLDGLQYNTLAALQTGDERIFIQIHKSFPAIEAFRKCVDAIRI
ncbi:MAG: excinuclease ABC subunit B [Pseudomonadota bacterium]